MYVNGSHVGRLWSHFVFVFVFFSLFFLYEVCHKATDTSKPLSNKKTTKKPESPIKKINLNSHRWRCEHKMVYTHTPLLSSLQTLAFILIQTTDYYVWLCFHLCFQSNVLLKWIYKKKKKTWLYLLNKKSLFLINKHVYLKQWPYWKYDMWLLVADLTFLTDE